jgi:hypothetical protein
MAKYKFKPKVGSIILETARSAPPVISNAYLCFTASGS